MGKPGKPLGLSIIDSYICLSTRFAIKIDVKEEKKSWDCLDFFVPAHLLLIIGLHNDAFSTISVYISVSRHQI